MSRGNFDSLKVSMLEMLFWDRSSYSSFINVSFGKNSSLFEVRLSRRKLDNLLVLRLLILVMALLASIICAKPAKHSVGRFPLIWFSERSSYSNRGSFHYSIFEMSEI